MCQHILQASFGSCKKDVQMALESAQPSQAPMSMSAASASSSVPLGMFHQDTARSVGNQSLDDFCKEQDLPKDTMVAFRSEGLEKISELCVLPSSWVEDFLSRPQCGLSAAEAS